MRKDFEFNISIFNLGDGTTASVFARIELLRRNCNSKTDAKIRIENKISCNTCNYFYVGA